MPTSPWTSSIHTFEPGSDGQCTGGWTNDFGQWINCRSTQRSSVLHNDLESDFRERHWHGGRDCMCFEDDEGPSFYDAMQEYVRQNS